MKQLMRILQEYQDQYISIWCVRYTYRGRVNRVTKDYVELLNPHMVEVAAKDDKEKPAHEDHMNSPAIISLASIEMVHQPIWASYQCSKCLEALR